MKYLKGGMNLRTGKVKFKHRPEICVSEVTVIQNVK